MYLCSTICCRKNTKFRSTYSGRSFTWVYTSYEKWTRKNGGTWALVKQEKIAAERCKPHHLRAKDSHNYKAKKLKNYFCSSLNHSAGGAFNENEVDIVIFAIKRCNNKTSKVKCLNFEESMRKLGEEAYFFKILRSDLVNPKRYTFPIESNYEFFDKQVGLNNLYINKAFFNEAQIRSDINPLFNTWVKQDFLELDKLETDSSIRGKKDTIIQVEIYISNKKHNYQRIYIKIPAITARVGGFLNLFMTFINLFFNSYLDNEYNIYMIHKLFKLEVEEENNSDREKGNIYF